MLEIGERISLYEPLWENWYKEKYIGGGTFGKVYKFRQELYGEVHYSAVKVIPIILEQELSSFVGDRKKIIEDKKLLCRMR